MSMPLTTPPPPLLPGDPVFAVVRVFQADDRLWRWRVQLWHGNVDVMHVPPARTVESKRGYKSRGVAYYQGLEAAKRVVF